MPKLSDESREKWREHERHSNAFYSKIEAKYQKNKKRHIECRLCGDMVTTIEPKDVFEVLLEHEKSHPEYDEWVALGREFPITALSGIWHDHDCIYVKCACICGCKSDICVANLPEDKRNIPMLCDMCVLYQDRGHVEHRLSSE